MTRPHRTAPLIDVLGRVVGCLSWRDDRSDEDPLARRSSRIRPGTRRERRTLATLRRQLRIVAANRARTARLAAELTARRGPRHTPGFALSA